MIEALYLVLPLLVVQRLLELALSRRNASRIRARGGFEVGAAHYPVIVAVHVLWFVGMIAEIVLLERAISRWWAPLLAIAVVAQGVRVWAIRSLGERWNTRIYVVPGAAPVTGGPYRYLAHPNYAAVIVELAVIPLIFGAYLTAIALSVANLLVLRHRIAIEDQALSSSARM